MKSSSSVLIMAPKMVYHTRTTREWSFSIRTDPCFGINHFDPCDNDSHFMIMNYDLSPILFRFDVSHTCRPCFGSRNKRCCVLLGCHTFVHGSGALGCFGGLARWIHLGTEARNPCSGDSIGCFGRCSHSLGCVAGKGAKESHHRAVDPNPVEAEGYPQETKVPCVSWSVPQDGE